MGKLFKEFRNKLEWTQTKYAKLFNIALTRVRHWEYNLISIPFREICRIIRLNGLDPYEEINKRFSYLYTKNIRLPIKPSYELIKLIRYLIPQKSFNHACVIKRESTEINKKKLKSLIKGLEKYFNCKVRINKYSGAYYIYSTDLALFLDTFFVYEKSWKIMNQNELSNFYKNMIRFLGGEQLENLLPFEKVKREVFVKKEAETNPNYGMKPEERSIEELIKYGIINLNKSSGPT